MVTSSMIFLLLVLVSHLPIHTSTYITTGSLDPSRCVSFTCGNFSDVRYPFWSDDLPQYCGHPAFKLDCTTNPPSATFTISALPYLVVDMSPDDRIMTIARTDVVSEQEICSNSHQTLANTNLDDVLPSLFWLTSKDENATLLYNCDDDTTTTTTQFPNKFICLIGASPRDAYLESATMSLSNGPPPRGCTGRVSVPVLVEAAKDLMTRRSDSVTVLDVLRRGFQVKWEVGMDRCEACRSSGGVCGYNNGTSSSSTSSTSSVVDGFFACLCPDSDHRAYAYATSCPTGSSIAPSSGTTEKSSKRTTTIIGVVSGVVASALLMSLVWIICQRRKRRRKAPSSYASRSISSYSSSRSDVEKGSRYLGVHLFSYTELVEATKNFDEKQELGDGGFGTVYYGKLKDGREVAVKRLYENNYKRVEQFMNEVDILTRLHHKNLVILYGCTSRHSRELLLVYEYIENGTIADHLHGAKARPGSLSWPMRLNIAVETASALTYLHASDIIHRDVKTNNILLDKNFCVKVADFGLSRLFPIDVTHISTAPQGTPGYVDPEYHQCYQLTGKSDVYSFGVVLAELISSLPAVDITRHRHEINLFNMAINKIQTHTLHEFVDPSLGFSSDETVHKSISAVAELAFQCLQSSKELRPTMDEVLETLIALQTGERNPDRSPDKDTTSDDVGLLKYGPSPLSPVSVTANWSSSSSITTPNISS